MSITFRKVDGTFTDFGLLSKTGMRKGYTLYSYYYKDKYIQTNKREVAREVTELLNGGVGGYIYVGHLSDYDNHPKRHKDGYMNIGHLEEQEFIDLVAEVTKHYK